MDILIQPDEENDLCYLGFSAAALTQGSVAKTIRVSDDIALDFDSAGRLVGLDIMNASEVLADDFANVRLDALVGVKEAAALLEVQPSNFVRDYASKEDFPRPVSELSNGRIWLRSQVEAYGGRKRASKQKTVA